MNNGIQNYKDTALLHLRAANRHGHLRHGTKLASHLFLTFPCVHIMLDGDDDGSAVLLLSQCYKKVIAINMDSALDGTKVYQKISDANESQKSETYALSLALDPPRIAGCVCTLPAACQKTNQILCVSEKCVALMSQITSENTQVHVPKQPRLFCFKTTSWPHALGYHWYLDLLAVKGHIF